MNRIITEVGERGRGSLIKWRERYERREYPGKILLNMFYTIAPLDCIWGDIQRAFGSGRFPATPEGFHAAKQQVATEYQRARQAEVLPNLERWLEKGLIVGECESGRYGDTVRRAASGSNADVEELEFTYIYYDIVNSLIVDWAALGRTGVDHGQAFAWVTDTRVGGVEYGSLRSLMAAMNPCVSFALGSGGVYRALPPLW